MSSLIRKAMWPAALVGALAVFFGAFGSGNVQTAFAAEGDVCAIIDERPEADPANVLGGTISMGVDEEVDITALFEDSGPGHDVDININDGSGQGAIASIDDDGDGDTDELATAVDHLNSMETQLLLDAEGCGDPAESGAVPAVRSILVSAAEDGERCVPDGTAPNFNGTDCSDPTPNDDNDGGDDSDEPFDDADIDCGTEDDTDPCAEQASASDFDTAAAVIVDGLEDGDSCSEIGQDVNEALIGQGTSEFVAFQFGDFVEDFCNGDIEDNRGNAGEANFFWVGTGLEVGFDDIDLDFDVVGEDSQILIDIICVASGNFTLTFAPEDGSEAGSVEVICGGEAETAEISSQRSILEVQPTGVAPHGFGDSIITVTVFDRHGDRVDGAEVTFTTDNCRFQNVGDDNQLSPATTGTTVTTFSDSDTTSDTNFVTNNPLQSQAGTAEVLLNCVAPHGTPGEANITAIVQREGSDIVLDTMITVIGQTAANGLTLTLTPDDLQCGETVLAVATAVDANGAPVSNGTLIRFTTDTSSGVVGGVEGAQGGVPTVGGSASVHIATDPSKPGPHTVIASVENAAGGVTAQVAKTYECDVPAPAAPVVVPTVSSPGTGTGTGTITPPSTGDAGLASASSSSALFVIVGAAAFVLAGLVSFRFARQS